MRDTGLMGETTQFEYLQVDRSGDVVTVTLDERPVNRFTATFEPDDAGRAGGEQRPRVADRSVPSPAP